MTAPSCRAIWEVIGPVLELDEIVVRYGSNTAVDGVSLTVDPNRTVAVLGPNGAGKTSLGRACMGLVRHGGRVRVDGEDISRRRPDQRHRRGLAYVPSSARVFPTLTVRENIEFQNGVPKSYWPTITARFPILGEKEHQPAGQLSGGQQQLLSIMRALAVGPRYLILDEPSAGLAPVVVKEIFDILADLPGGPVGVLLLEQNASLGLGIADDCVVIVRGQTRLSGRAADLIGSPELQHLYLGMPGGDPAKEPTQTSP